MWEFDYETRQRPLPSHVNRRWGRIVLDPAEFPDHRSAFMAAFEYLYRRPDVAMVTTLACVSWPEEET